MTAWQWLLLGAGVVVATWIAVVGALLLAGRRGDARALAGFVPDCVVLLRRLLGDERLPWRSRLLLAATIGYLAMPFDLVPDVIPVAGQLDDALVVALALRGVLRAAGPELVAERWPGPPASLELLSRLAGARR